MDIYSKNVPKFTLEQQKKRVWHLFNVSDFRIFALRNELNHYNCSVLKSLKIRRGYCIAGLVRFATTQIPAPLFSFLPLLKVANNAH